VGLKRERLEVIYDLLSIIRLNNNSIKQTPLLRFSNLSSQRFLLYYTELIDKKFIIDIFDKKNKKTISLTEQGYEYLDRYKMIKGFIDDFNL
jgi:predicted transcriptional regulator